MIGTSETHHGDIKAVSFKEKNHGNSTKSGNKTPSISKAHADSRIKTITLTPIAVLEPLSSPAIKTVLMSVRRAMVGQSKPPGTGTGFPTSKNLKD